MSKSLVGTETLWFAKAMVDCSCFTRTLFCNAAYASLHLENATTT